MKVGMSIQELLQSVVDQTNNKADFLVNTETAIYVEQAGREMQLAMRDNSFMGEKRFGITDHAHSQLATKLGIPQKYYQRLMADHPDLLIPQINALMQREPSMRMLRTLNGDVRAFLSDKYKRMDNDKVLENTLPMLVNGDIETKLLSSHVNENKLYMKLLFPDEKLARQIGFTRTGEPDIIHPGLMLTNSETGQGSLQITGFFYRTFCENGCHFGGIDAVSFKRTHLGSRIVGASDYLGNLLSQETMNKETELMLSQTKDMIRAISSESFVDNMASRLRQAAESQKIVNPVEAVDILVKETTLLESEKSAVLENLIADQDYSQWGVLNAITKVANADVVSYTRATELEQIGSRIIDMPRNTWRRIAEAA